MNKKAVLFATVFAASTFTLGAATGSRITATLMKAPIVCKGQTSYQEVISYKGGTYVPLRSFGTLTGTAINYQNGVIYVGDNPGTFTPAAQKTNTTVAASYSRKNPAPLGVAQSLKGVACVGKVTVESVERGDDAWQRVLAASHLAEAAPAGKEYLVAKIKFEAVQGNDLCFESFVNYAFSSSDVEYSEPAGVLVEDAIKDKYLNAGQSAEGYAVYLVDQSDKAPKLCYGSPDTKFNIWFSLK